jgi:hypothetical protein
MTWRPQHLPPVGRPVDVEPWRLALVMVMQYIEGLTDRQAADAVRRCMDWKYVLSLELTDPGFDFTLLAQEKASCDTMQEDAPLQYRKELHDRS